MLTLDLKNMAAEAVRVYREGDFENAARLFGEAASAFQAQGDMLEAAEMKNNQSVAFLQCGDPQASYDAALGTPEIFSAAGDSKREGMALGNLASALVPLGRTEEAISFYRLAADALEKAGEDQLRASVMQALSAIQMRKGKLVEALISMQAGLAGVKHPTLKQKILRGLLRLRTW
jgi:tetratricopeptide (TPR) repeat protein